MKTKLILTALLIMGLGNTHGAKAQAVLDGKKILIVYFSWSSGGNTRNMAQQIQAATGADIFEIVPVDAYPADYNACVNQAKEEINRKHKPAIKGTVENLSSYDIIIVGSPNWWSTIAPPVATFLTGYDLGGKTILPFMTHGGGRMGNAVNDIKELCPNSIVANGLPISGGSVRDDSTKGDIAKWLRDNAVME